MVELPRFGRKGTLALSTVLTGVFLYGSTTATTSNALLGWQCAYNFVSNIMYAVLYAYTPEIFPTKDRGTGNALTATANRVFGIMAVSLMPPSLTTFAPTGPRLNLYHSPSLPCSPTCRPRRPSMLVGHCFWRQVSWSLLYHSSRRERQACESGTTEVVSAHLYA